MIDILNLDLYNSDSCCCFYLFHLMTLVQYIIPLPPPAEIKSKLNCFVFIRIWMNLHYILHYISKRKTQVISSHRFQFILLNRKHENVIKEKIMAWGIYIFIAFLFCSQTCKKHKRNIFSSEPTKLWILIISHIMYHILFLFIYFFLLVPERWERDK